MSAAFAVPRPTPGGTALSPEQLDLAVWPTFDAMRERGIRVDVGRLRGLHADVAAELDAQEAALGAYAGRDLNPYSSQDVGAWLKAEGLAGRRRTRGGAVATDERALALLTEIHPVPGCVLECRGLRKLLTTFIEPVLAKVEGMAEPTVHPRWRLTKVKSGRPSMEDPNLLAFPTRDKYGKRVRDAFVARPGHVLVSVDFNQVEPRIAAALSQDPAMMAVFRDGRDIYADMARRIFKADRGPDAIYKTEPWKTKERQPAKVVILGCTLYGMQAPLLYDTLIKDGCGTSAAPFYPLDHDEQCDCKGDPRDVPTCKRVTCVDFVRRRFEPYPGVGKLYGDVVRLARAADGWARTTGGRGRFLPALLVDGNRWPAAKLREEAERQAFNHLIQGTAQETMKEAMLRVERMRVGAFVHPLLQIYDELIFETPAGAASQDVAKTVAAMMAGQMGGVEITTSWSVGESWSSLK